MQKLYEYLKKQPLCYIAANPYNIDGIDFSHGGIYAITNNTPGSQELKKQYGDNIFIIQSDTPLDTFGLLSHAESSNILNGKSVVVFKNTPRIERFCTEHNLVLLNPKAELVKQIEEKISQVTWLEEDTSLLPPHIVTKVKDILWDGTTKIAQFNSGHTGEGTILLDAETKLEHLKKQFPEREVRLTEYIQGTLYTSNPLIHENNVVPGNISLQITGIHPFTDLQFGSVGNDWAFAHTELTPEDVKKYRAIEHAIGVRLIQSGWKGLFSIDIIREAETGNFYLIEVNARQGASASFESTLQKTHTILEAHLASLLSLPIETPTPITRGAHIFPRVTESNASTYPTHAHNTIIGHITKEDYIMDTEKTVRADLYTTAQAPGLSEKAQQTMHAYLNFSLGGPAITVPYYINRGKGVRGGLNAFVGKGSPEDIHTESMLLAKRAHLDTAELTTDDLTHLLVDNNIGIDCSGFVFHVLNSESKAKTGKPLRAHLTFPKLQYRFIHKLRALITPERHADVVTFASDANSTTISPNEAKPGDVITMLSEEAGRNHILLITNVTRDKNVVIEYTHSLAWSTDGRYGHGVRTGNIVLSENQSLAEGVWTEKGVTGEKNETYTRALKSNTELRRLKAFA